MKRMLWSAVAGSVIAICSSSPASATAVLALVSGSSTLNVSDNGAVSCTGPGCSVTTPPADQNVLTGGISLSGFTFNGWTITVNAGGSNSPGCMGTNGPGCLNSTSINAISSGAGTLTAYFADTGFTTQGTLTVANASSQQTGTSESRQAYAFTGPLPSGLTTQPANGALAFTPAGGTCGPALVSTPPGVTATATGCTAPSAPYDLELATTFTATAANQGFNVNGNITASSVPEPVSMSLLGGGLALLGLARWRKAAKKS